MKPSQKKMKESNLDILISSAHTPQSIHAQYF